MLQESQESQEFDPIQFGIGVLKDHEVKLFHLIQTAIQQPVNHYTDREGNLDRSLVSQQLALRSTLLLNLSNQLGRLQVSLYALACQRVGQDYGELLNDLTETVTKFEEGMDRVQVAAMQKLPVAPAAPPEPEPEEEPEPAPAEYLEAGHLLDPTQMGKHLREAAKEWEDHPLPPS